MPDSYPKCRIYGEKIFFSNLIQVLEGVSFRHLLIKVIKIVDSLMSIFAIWID